MEVFITLLAIVGISHVLKETDGPFNILNHFRNILARLPLIGSFFVNVLSCNFCTGFWASCLFYLSTNTLSSWNIGEHIVWSFAGAVFNKTFWEISNLKFDLKIDKHD